MLTRAYDAAMAALQVPMALDNEADFNNTTVDDSVLNCKDCNGNVTTMYSPSYYRDARMHSTDYFRSYFYPFAHWDMNNNSSSLLPDEEESTPDYEDYSVANGALSGWTSSSQNVSFSKSYDPGTKEIVCSVTVLWQNTSGAAKTVYGVKVRYKGYFRVYSAATNESYSYFLACREHFASPIVVEDQGIISLTFTWRVGRAGLVSATAASAE